MSDIITITGIAAFGRHGVFEHERVNGQEFSVDLVAHIDARAAAVSDDLDDSVDYGAMAQVAHDILTGEPANLIETVAVRIADAILQMPGVVRIVVTVHKPQAPIPVPFTDVSITVTRP